MSQLISKRYKKRGKAVRHPPFLLQVQRQIDGMKRLLLLLPLLLLAACNPAAPRRLTPELMITVLREEIDEIQAGLTQQLSQDRALGDLCASVDTVSAGMEKMLAPKWSALGVALEEQGKIGAAKQAKGFADKTIRDAKQLKRSCSELEED